MTRTWCPRVTLWEPGQRLVVPSHYGVHGAGLYLAPKAGFSLLLLFLDHHPTGGPAVTESLDDASWKPDSADRGAPPAWRKSTRSIANGQCLETATLGGRLVVRDSLDKAGPTAGFTVSGWRTFLKEVKRGYFDAM